MDKKTAVGITAAATITLTALWGSYKVPTDTHPVADCVPDITCLLPCVDRESTDSLFCLACHADDVAGHSLGDTATNHPFGVDYYSNAPAVHLRPTPLPGVVLVGSQVECTSCHNYWAVPRHPHWTALPDTCIACHNM